MIIIFYDNFENESKKNATELRTPKVTNVHRVVVDFLNIWLYYEKKLEESILSEVVLYIQKYGSILFYDLDRVFLH